MPPGIFTGEFHRFCCPRFARAAKLHEAKQTFLSCIIPYFFLPISVAKAAFVMRATASVKWTIFNQLTHNYINNYVDGSTGSTRKKKLGETILEKEF